MGCARSDESRNQQCQFLNDVGKKLLLEKLWGTRQRQASDVIGEGDTEVNTRQIQSGQQRRLSYKNMF
jgi:hypothetical protein